MIKDKIIRIELHGRNRRFYNDFGVKNDDTYLEVNQLQLSSRSTIEVECSCDNCNAVIYRKVRDITNATTFCSKECKYLNWSEKAKVNQESIKNDLKEKLILKIKNAQSLLYSDLKREDINFLWNIERYFGSLSNLFLEIGITQEEMIKVYGFSRNINKRLLTYEEVKDRLFYLKSIKRLTTNATRTEFEDGQRLERTVKSMFGSFDEGLKHFGLSRDFTESNELINSGLHFQAILKDIYEAIGFNIIQYDKRINGIAPDFRMENNVWVDAKLSAWTPTIEGSIEKYSPHCDKLVIVYMRGNRNKNHKNKKVSFKKIDEYFPLLVNVGREDLIERINLLHLKFQRND